MAILRYLSIYLQRFSWATEFAIRRIYKESGLHGVSPRFITTRVEISISLKKLIKYVNEAWATDITYIKLGKEVSTLLL